MFSHAHSLSLVHLEVPLPAATGGHKAKRPYWQAVQQLGRYLYSEPCAAGTEDRPRHAATSDAEFIRQRINLSLLPLHVAYRRTYTPL